MTDDQKAKRLHYHMYESLEGIEEHAERIVSLEVLCQEMYPYVGESCPEECEYQDECFDDSNLRKDGLPRMCVAYNHIGEKLRKLGVEVDE